MKNILLVVFLLSAVQLSFGQEKERQRPDRDVAKKGSYVDGLAALGSVYAQYNLDSHYYDNHEYRGSLNGIGLRFGTVWYWQRANNYKIGLNVIWANTTFLIGNEYTFQFLPLNLGLSNIWKLNEKKAIEANLNVGWAIRFVGNTGHGIAINPEVKFRLGRTLIGIGYQYVYTSDSFYKVATHQIILSAGLFQY